MADKNPMFKAALQEIGMARLPFSVFRREGRRFYYVQFKGEKGEYLAAVSTKQTSEAQAIEIAFKWLREGKPLSGGEGTVKVPLLDVLRDVKTPSEAEFICKELNRLGLLKSYVITGSQKAVNFSEFLLNFWDYDASPYIKEKLHKDHAIHRNYTVGQTVSIKKYWEPYFKDRVLGDITRKDIETFLDSLSRYGISSGRKNHILKAGTISLRWAYAKEIIDKDITKGITLFSKKIKERQILSPEIAQALFQVPWPDERVRLANMLAAVTGLRAGEIQGLQTQDLGQDCLYVRHSWNYRDGLKTTKNNEPRIVEVPFPYIINELLNLTYRNPHGAGMDSYIFWSTRLASRPMDAIPFVTGLRDALVKTGMSKKSSEVYVFHGWRHFFTTYMRGRVTDKLLQSQTGHKVIPMLDHYSDHHLVVDRELIQQAQKDVFGALIPISRLGQ
jgi:integrase